MNVDAEILNLSQLLNLLCRKEELCDITEVLSDGPEDLTGVDITLVPVQKFLGSGDILSDRLLGQDMLTGEQCFPNKLRLNQDGKPVGIES